MEDKIDTLEPLEIEEPKFNSDIEEDPIPSVTSTNQVDLLSSKEKNKKLCCPCCPKWMKLTFIILGIIFLTYIVFALISFIVAAVSTSKHKKIWLEWQSNYISYLTEQYASSPDFSRVNDSTFMLSTITPSDFFNSKINKIRLLASHNSYKTGLSPGTKFLYHVPLFFALGHKDDYVFDTITEQLNLGIRSIELDPSYEKLNGTYTIEVCHNEVLETSSSGLDFKLILKEIKMWMDRNPDATFISVILETKKPKKFKNSKFDLLEQIIEEVFGDKLIKPKEMLGEYEDFDEMRLNDAYPTVEELKGRIMFFLHEESNLKNYLSRDPDTNVLNIALKINGWKNSEYKKRSFLVIANDPRLTIIKDIIKKDNFMIRSRLDLYDDIDKNIYLKGLESNANLVTTDYTPHVDKRIYDYPTKEMWNEKYLCILYEVNKTMALRKDDD